MGLFGRHRKEDTEYRKSGSASTYYNSARNLDLQVSAKDGKVESLNLYMHGIYG